MNQRFKNTDSFIRMAKVISSVGKENPCEGFKQWLAKMDSLPSITMDSSRPDEMPGVIKQMQDAVKAAEFDEGDEKTLNLFLELGITEFYYPPEEEG